MVQLVNAHMTTKTFIFELLVITTHTFKYLLHFKTCSHCVNLQNMTAIGLTMSVNSLLPRSNLSNCVSLWMDLRVDNTLITTL